MRTNDWMIKQKNERTQEEINESINQWINEQNNELHEKKIKKITCYEVV